MRVRGGVIVALVAVATSAAAQPSVDGDRAVIRTVTQESVEALIDPFVRSQLERRRIAGAVVTVVANGTVLLSRGYGRADIATGRAMTTQTLVRVGSLTKMLTAIAAMQLVEDGRLDLDRDVRDYVDTIIPDAADRPVTLRQLLSHQTGFEDRIGGIGSPSGDRLPLGPFLSRHLPSRLAQDDAAIAYSNVNASLVAYLIERVAGVGFETYLAERIFQPLGMQSSTAEQPPPPALRVRLSSGYLTSDQSPTPISMADATIHEVGSTGVVSSGEDMGRLLIALLDVDPRVLERASLDSMMVSQRELARGTIGLGFYAPLGLNGDPFIGHGGDTGSFHSVLALMPQQRFGLFVSYNSDGTPEATPPHLELLEHVTDHFFLRLPVAKERPLPAGVDGTYAPARRVDSNVFALRALAAQVSVRVSSRELTFGPAFLAFGGFALQEVWPGVYRGRGFAVSFDRAGGVPVMQIGSPVLRYVQVPWWQSATVVVPLTLVSGLVALAGVLGWPIAIVRAARHEMGGTGRRLRWVTRAALLLDLTAVLIAVWLVFVGWPLVALSSPAGTGAAAIMYAAAWMAVLLTPLVVWHACRLAVRRTGTRWLRGREYLFVLAHLVLVTVCLQWRIAGITFAL